MYPVKDYTFLGGCLRVFQVMTAVYGILCLFGDLPLFLQAMAEYGMYGIGGSRLLNGISLLTGLFCMACVAVLMRRKGRLLRRMFLALGACNILVLTVVECTFLFPCLKRLASLNTPAIQIMAMVGGFLTASLARVAYYAGWSVCLLRSRRAAVYFGEAQPMWYECGCFAPYGAQPPFGAPAQPPYGYGPQGPAQAYGPGAAPAQAPGAPAQPAAPQTPAAAPQPGAGLQAGPPQALPVQHTPAGGMVCPACGMQGLPGASFCTVCGARLVPAAQGGPAQGRVQTKEDEPHV